MTFYYENNRKSSTQKPVSNVEISSFAKNMLKKIVRRDKKTKEILESMINQVKSNPTSGKQLERELIGLRSFASENKEYRIIYFYNSNEDYILIHGAGFRKNIYDQLIKVLRIKRSN